MKSASGQENMGSPPPLKLKKVKSRRHIVVKEMGFTFCGLKTPEWYSEDAPECKNCRRSYDASRRKSEANQPINGIAFKPCPFCGGTNIKNGWRDFVPYVDCKDCRISVDFWNLGGSADSFPTSMQRWNKRSPPL